MSIRSTLLPLTLLAASCADDGRPQGSWHKIGPAAPLTGAIFTTLADGTAVDANIYDAFCDVYLNGGPAPGGAAGLPEGDYYFQVTDPSGMTLLSTDTLAERQFHVDATGRISGLSGGGNHDTGNNLVDGGVTVQLCPFLATPNPGCEFKVWVSRVADIDLTAPASSFGFVPSTTKTDNFKVCEDGQAPDAGPPPPDAGPPPPDAGPQPDAEEEEEDPNLDEQGP